MRPDFSAAALTGFKEATDHAQSALAAHDELLLGHAIGDMADEFTQLQHACLTLAQLNSILEEKVSELSDKVWQLQQQDAPPEHDPPSCQIRYDVILSRSKAALRAPRKRVHLCASCAAAGVKTFLRPKGKNWLVCHVHGKVRSDTPCLAVAGLHG